ncbi:TatD family hydrolase [Marinomonas sp. 2405UD68-3]|uniref:TatD family hydrolase n=1 Tax=Marinomonas sp. 2405UD68-3 TaxID=3391835 RepID=UPI0039C98449
MIDVGVNLSSVIDLDKLNVFMSELDAANVTQVIAISSNLSESYELVSLLKQYPNTPIRYTIGCHPHHASQWNNKVEQEICQLINDAHPIAIGETGLDFNRNFSTPAEQLLAFESQISIAETTELPLYLHEREAEDPLINILSNHKQIEGVIHCFTGNKDTLKRYLDLNLYIGVTGWLCDERRGHDLKEAVKYIPNDRLLIETDSPYLIPRIIRPRPKKNHPKFLSYIGEELANIRNQSTDDIIKLTTENAQRLFSL